MGSEREHRRTHRPEEAETGEAECQQVRAPDVWPACQSAAQQEDAHFVCACALGLASAEE